MAAWNAVHKSNKWVFWWQENMGKNIENAEGENDNAIEFICKKITRLFNEKIYCFILHANNS